jgi:CopG antitoxin of type II toxin-antitoxin system
MPKKKPRKRIPTFEDEAQEQEFWSTHDSTDYVDWSQAQRVTFGRLKPSEGDDFYPVTGGAAGRFETVSQQA